MLRRYTERVIWDRRALGVFAMGLQEDYRRSTMTHGAARRGFGTLQGFPLTSIPLPVGLKEWRSDGRIVYTVWLGGA